MDKTDAMEEKTSAAQLSINVFTECKLTICDKIPDDDEKLYVFITDTLKFKIIKTGPLVIKKDSASLNDIQNLYGALMHSLQSHNRKDDELTEHSSDSSELKQREGNVTSESLGQTFSLQKARQNMLLTNYTVQNDCGDNNSYEVSSEQTQGSNDDVLTLDNRFRNLTIHDKSDDNYHIEEHNLSGNTFQRLSCRPVEPENDDITLMKNTPHAGKQENSTQERGEDKKQVETTQPEYHSKQTDNIQLGYPRKLVATSRQQYFSKQIETTQPEYCSKQVETTQPRYHSKQLETTQPEYLSNQVETTRPEYRSKQAETTQPEYHSKQVETTQPEYHSKQVETTQPEYHSKQVETTHPEYHRKQVETTQPEYRSKQIETTQPEYRSKKVETTQPEYRSKQVETTQPEYRSKQAETTQPEYHSKQVETTQPEYRSKQIETTQPEYRSKQIETTQPEYRSKQVETTQPEYLRKQAETTQPEYLSKQVETTQPEYRSKQVETTQPEYHRKQAETTQPEYFSKQLETTQPEYLSKEVETTQPEYRSKQAETRQPEYHSKQVETTQPEYHSKQIETTQPEYEMITESIITSRQESLSHRDTVTDPDIAYRSETREDNVRHPASVQNLSLPSMNDIASQEHLHQQKDSVSGNMQMSFKDSGLKNTSIKQREFETSKISSRIHKLHDNTDSSDSDGDSENVTIYSIRASTTDGIEMYLNEPRYKKYFNDVKTEGKDVIFKLNPCNDRDVSFLDTLKQLKVEECEFDNKDKSLISAIQDIQTQIRQLLIHIKDNTVQIVGVKASVISAKKKLQFLLQNFDKNNSQYLDLATDDKSTATRTESLDKNNPDTRNWEMSRKDISDDEKRRPQKSKFNDMHPRVPESHTSDYNSHSHSSSLSEDRNPKHKASKTTYSGNSEHCIFSKDNNIYYAANEKSKLKVQILKTDITKLKVDCIVNAANKRLQHGAGVARAISTAAGSALKKECEEFIHSGKRLAVTDIFVSTGGNMPAKCVIHAIGPKWESYDDNSKSQCLQDLRHTVIRCLVEADRRGFTSIALPSISAAIFKVPKEACAKCYMEAVKHFGSLSGEQTSLCDIRFVDVDEAMVKTIQDCFQGNWTKPCDFHTLQEDGEFAKAHVYSDYRNAEKLPDTNRLASLWSSSVSTKTLGVSKSSSVVGDRSQSGKTVVSGSDFKAERNPIYQIGKFTLDTDTRPAFNHSADITITVGRPFDKLSGLHDFSVSSKMEQKESLKNIYKVFSVSKPNGQQEKSVCALLPEPDDADTIKQAIGNLSTIIQSPNKKIFMKTIRKVVLTSSILYDEPSNTKKQKEKPATVRKKVGDFARCLFEYLDKASGISASSISITVVGNEEALQSIHKVLESRGVKKIPPEVRQGARGMAREPSPHHHSGNSGQYPWSAARGTDHTKQHGEEVRQGARSNIREPSPHRQIGNSGQYPGSAARGTDHTKQHGEEVRQGARRNIREPSPHRQFGNSGQYPGSAARGTDHTKQHGEEDVGSSVDSENLCVICAWTRPLYPARCCGKFLCQTCEQRMSGCPFCRTFWRILIGDQPPGTMTVLRVDDYADGYESTRVWQIKYSFPSGLQKENHPHPRKAYTGMSRTAFLPINNEGWHVLRLLRLAFLRKLTFTIGRSLTMGREDSIVWNDIHHKTHLHGGPHGYPDPNYLFKVKQELANKGVTFDLLTEDERYELERFEQDVYTGYFSDTYPK